MEFICVSRIAKEYHMDVTDVFLQVQQELFDNGYEWYGGQSEYSKLEGGMSTYHDVRGGLVLLLEGSKMYYASEEYCWEEYGEYTLEVDSIPVQPLAFKLKLDKVVKLEGTYTKETMPKKFTIYVCGKQYTGTYDKDTDVFKVIADHLEYKYDLEFANAYIERGDWVITPEQDESLDSSTALPEKWKINIDSVEPETITYNGKVYDKQAFEEAIRDAGLEPLE